MELDEKIHEQSREHPLFVRKYEHIPPFHINQDSKCILIANPVPQKKEKIII